MRILINRVYMAGMNYVECVGTSDEVAQLPTEGIITGSRFVCVDTGNIYLFDETGIKWNGPFKLYERIQGE